jgi:hypothetical protein
MQIQATPLMAALMWNAKQRDGQRKVLMAATHSNARIEAQRNIHRFQRNIDRLNRELRALDNAVN